MKAEIAILAGGLATRLAERARSIPKSLLPVGGRPFIAWQLERIAASHFQRVLICTGHLSAQIRDFVGDGSAFGLSVDYSDDGAALLGTGGAVAKALPELSDCFVVTYGDSYLPFDYRAPLRELTADPRADGCLAVYKNDGRWDASNARVERDQVVAYEKGGRGFDHIDYGAIALRKRALIGYGAAHFGLDEVQSALAQRGSLRAFIASERFYEVGSERGLHDFEAFIEQRSTLIETH